MNNNTPELVLKKLKQDASNKVQETLDAIYQVCVEQAKHGLYDFSIATISRLGKNRGVPKAQSIRNKSGEKYRALIQCFSDNRGPKLKVNRKESWIDEIDNPKHRLLTQMLAAELASTKHKLNEIVPPETVINVFDHNEPIDEYSKLTQVERRALNYILSDSFKNKWHLSETEYGELVDENGKALFKPATIDAIKKALRYL
ncbi:gamma-mobile-trio protein GmtX [Psychrosphaera algicola]|uniref:Gamma-mobile-trio protein GmtX n=1 Tax=Psychrosphaera algicola TaxID=3023714 RepID=A0ABT5FGZ6_9GAMM|nr:gamma-mobile-trio protein GmtX [Psychrosphaera sp. G1-22]MDC2890346.1 gamma-mobile-trio protein GmtX [Psychrosphaera sp. G1-22]